MPLIKLLLFRKQADGRLIGLNMVEWAARQRRKKLSARAPSMPTMPKISHRNPTSSSSSSSSASTRPKKRLSLDGSISPVLISDEVSDKDELCLFVHVHTWLI